MKKYIYIYIRKGTYRTGGPRIERATVLAEERPGPHAELVHVGLAYQGRPRLPQAAGRGGVVGRREAREGGGGCRRLYAESAEVVLGGVGDAVQRADEGSWDIYVVGGGRRIS